MRWMFKHLQGRVSSWRDRQGGTDSMCWLCRKTVRPSRAGGPPFAETADPVCSAQTVSAQLPGPAAGNLGGLSRQVLQDLQGDEGLSSRLSSMPVCTRQVHAVSSSGVLLGWGALHMQGWQAGSAPGLQFARRCTAGAGRRSSSPPHQLHPTLTAALYTAGACGLTNSPPPPPPPRTGRQAAPLGGSLQPCARRGQPGSPELRHSPCTPGGQGGCTLTATCAPFQMPE